MVGLPATGELSYNGYLFDGATHIEAAVEFVYDDAGRTIIAHRHTITVDAIVADDSDLDGEVLNIRQRLGEAGKKLTFISKGFGDDLRAGRLEALLESSFQEDIRIHALYPHRKYLSAKVRRFVDFLAGLCGPNPPWDQGIPH